MLYKRKNTDYILEVFKVPTTDNILKPSLAYGNKIKAEFIKLF